MPAYEHILDNRGRAVADYLRKRLPQAAAFRLVSAYFTIYGYELLADELGRVGSVRFLFGDPASVGELDPGGKEPKSFELTEQGLAPNHTLHQKQLARRCAAWVRSAAVAVRSVSRSNFLHGKMYLTASPHGAAGIVGSSNFTKKGLGGSDGSNLEINLATADAAILAELRDWFDELWHNKQLTRDVKREVLDALNRIGKDHAPELIYYKTLYELFRADIEARRDGDQQLQDNHLYDTAIWNALYEFQKDGAKSVIARLKQHNGCILADSVGLGKTYTALAVIKYYEMCNERVLVLCPSKLRENWALYQSHTSQVGNPFTADRFGYSLLAHTDLSRDQGMSGSTNLEAFNWSSFDLVVIDESHNFRNMDGSRYQRLLGEVIGQGAKTKVLLLSATPVNISLTDLRNQIYLITEGREDSFRESLGVGNIRNLLGTAQREFKQWEADWSASGQRDKTALLEKLGADFFRLLAGISISRSRRQIKQFYNEEMDRIGEFPAHEKPHNVYPPTDLAGTLSYEELADQIDSFTLSVYRPSKYLVDPTRLQELKAERAERNFNQQDRERFLIGMLRTNFLKRLESSPHSLTLTLQRTVGKIDDLLARIDRYERGAQAEHDLGEVLPDDDEDDEEFLVGRGRRPYRLPELNLPGWKTDLRRDKATLTAALARVRAITPARDGKLHEIKQAIRHKAAHPTTNQDGAPNRKLLVFTTFKDTAVYLYDNLSGLAAELGLHMAMVSGDETRTTSGANTFHAILSNFAPVARGRAAPAAGDIDLLIATDCISEGQNLQDCDTVLHYDIHWNPVRLIQRLGRIDRIGSRNRSVRMVSYWPTQDMDAYLKLRSRVQARMALADVAASGDDDPFTKDQAEGELKFRDKQLLLLREEIQDLDELDDNVVLGDFTLDHFFTQLLRYLERNREELEATPLGAYAVTDDAGAAAADSLRPGVIFFLRQRNAATDRRQQPASPIHPYYTVYIRDDGHIRYGCANARQVLNAFEAAAVGKTEPITVLCNRFDRETAHGQDMAHYDTLLTDTIAHVRQAHSATQIEGLGIRGRRDFVLPQVSETPQGADDFELVTWLVVSSR